MYEPASILAAPSSGQFISNGPRISATCAVYGSPIPYIQWTQAGQVVTEDSYTNIYTQSMVDQDGDILAISTLEMCDSVFMRGGGETSCITWNGVDSGSEERVQSVEFTIDPRSESNFGWPNTTCLHVVSHCDIARCMHVRYVRI